MATFSQALEHLKANGFVKREVIKNDTVIAVHKNRLYQMSQETGVRYPYVPTNKDLISDDWILIKKLSLILMLIIPFFGISQFNLPENYETTSDLMLVDLIGDKARPCTFYEHQNILNMKKIELIKFFDFLSDNNVIENKENGRAFYWIEKFEEHTGKN